VHPVAFFHAKFHSGAAINNAEQWTVEGGRIRKGRVFYQDPTPVQEMMKTGASS
jgi:hypothetical protein